MAASQAELNVSHAAAAAVAVGDLAILPVDKSRRRLFADLSRLAGQLGPEGCIALYGGRKEGIGPAADFLARFCELEKAQSRAGLRLVIARPREPAPPSECREPYRAEARGRVVSVACRPGVFSWDSLDPASALMLENCVPRPENRLLDLGCGAGVVASLLLAGGEVATATLTDSDALALEAAGETLALNGLTAAIEASDAGDELPGKSFDLILCNPPFHKGFSTEHGTLNRMIEQGRRLLAARGRFFIVGPHTLALGGRLDPIFRRVDRVAMTPTAELWRASRPRRKLDFSA